MNRLVPIAFSLLLSSVCFACDDKEDVPAAAELFVTESELEIPAEGGEVSFALKSNTAWTVSSDAEWLSVSPLQGDAVTARNIAISAQANTSSTVRSANVNVASGDEGFTVAVRQKMLDFIRITPEAVNLENAEGGIFELQVSSSGDVVVDDNLPSWLHIKENKQGLITFICDANRIMSRQAVVHLSSGSAVADIEVFQPSGIKAGDMNVSAVQIASAIFAGINIGNTLEACDNQSKNALETMWGNPKVTETYIRGLKALGFNAVRIPCAWDYHIIDAATNKLDPAWLDRVAEVVSYCVGNDMYCFVNIHWDGGWLEESVVKGYDEKVDAKQHDLWTQIATRLKEFDYHLMFAGCNEPGQQDQTSVNSNSVNALVRYEQTFIDAVRATGGNNSQRCLIVQAPYTSIEKACDGSYSMPKDNVADRLMIEVHYYDPANFCIVGEDVSWGKGHWYWGAENFVAGSNRNSTWGDEAYAVSKFADMKKHYADNGIPTILGEYCSVTRSEAEYPGLDIEKHKASRALWNEVITREAKNGGCVPFYWETGGDINRSSGNAKNAYAIEGLMRGAAAGTYPFAQ